ARRLGRRGQGPRPPRLEEPALGLPGRGGGGSGMNRTDCSDYEGLLAAALAGELSAAERRALDEHLAECPRCAAEAASLGEIWRGLGRLEETAPSPFLAARFERMLSREIAAEATRDALAAAAPRRNPALAWAAGLAAALAAGVALGFFAATGGPR